MCVQNFDDSRGFAIRITYRISLRSSSLWEPRHPLLKVVVNSYIVVGEHATLQRSNVIRSTAGAVLFMFSGTGSGPVVLNLFWIVCVESHDDDQPTLQHEYE